MSRRGVVEQQQSSWLVQRLQACAGPQSFVEVMDWKVAAWELPSNICCMIREENLETKKVKEYVYQRRGAAEKKVAQLMKKDGIEFTVCTPEQIHFVSQLDIEDYEEDYDEQKDA